MHISEIIKKNFHEHLEVNQNSIDVLLPQIELATSKIINITDNSGKVMSCGNGGSSGDAQHIVSELVNRFEKERKEVAAVSLNSDTATITSIANDYDYKYIFKKFRSKNFFVNLHYMPLHISPFFKKKGFKLGQFPVAESYGKNSLSLPIFVDLKKKTIVRLCKLINDFF